MLWAIILDPVIVLKCLKHHSPELGGSVIIMKKTSNFESYFLATEYPGCHEPWYGEIVF